MLIGGAVVTENSTTRILYALAHHFDTPVNDDNVYPVFFAAYDYYYVPRGKPAEDVARKHVQYFCDRHIETGELPEWLIRVYEIVIEGDPPNMAKSVSPPQYAR